VSAATTNISFGAFFFTPRIVTISEGDTVVWTLAPGQVANHTVTGSASDAICGPGLVGSGCQHTFATAGNFPYICATFGHAGAGMTGLVQVVRSPPAPALLTNLVRLPDGQFRFTVKTTANRTNIVQASTNPVPSNWMPIGTLVPGSNSFVFTDTNAPGFRLRFYRVVEP
jgi:plastocyanin